MHVIVGLLFLDLQLSVSFNIDTQSWFAFSPPSNVNAKTSLFGHSVALGRDVAFIGAPRYDTSGGVFKCPFQARSPLGETNNLSCTQINDNLSHKTADFLGASMTTSRQGELFTCAPRQGSDRYLNPYNSLGTCYRFTEDRNNSLREYFRFDRKLLEFSDYGLLTIMGHELTMSEDDSLVIGAPMARTRDFNWKLERTVGSIVRASPFFIPRAKESPWSRVTLSNLGDPHTYDLAGSAIVRGRYYYDFGPNHYAVGAPKAIMMRGAVFVCPDCLSPQNTRSDKVRFDKQGFSLEGFQLGSRFGQTLCTLDLNGDGFDDLVVGAPLFTTKREQGEAGNVYVYKTNVRGHVTTMDLMNQDLPRKVESGARFGATLASLGNLDGDGLEDFAVGAPYENDGAGAIYVYRGSRSFVFSDISQKLTPADFPRLNMANFGFSANANQDVDGNGSPDLIIGSRGSRHTVLLRSLKVERIAPRSSFVAPTKVNPKDN
ncbi:hypothetical protein TCAL_16246, partial [Tigriopus californicus]